MSCSPDGARRRQIVDTLRLGDPAQGLDLPSSDVLEIRRQVLAAVVDRRQPGLGWLPATVAALVVAAAGLMLVLRAIHSTTPAPSSPAQARAESQELPPPVPAVPALPTTVVPEPVIASATAEPLDRDAADDPATTAALASRQVSSHRHLVRGENRNIYFATEGGTRVIWILNPSLDL